MPMTGNETQPVDRRQNLNSRAQPFASPVGREMQSTGSPWGAQNNAHMQRTYASQEMPSGPMAGMHDSTYPLYPQDARYRPPAEIPRMQHSSMQSAPQIVNTPDGQVMQVIAVPAGAAPPEGAILVGPAPTHQSAMAVPLPEDFIFDSSRQPWSNQKTVPEALAPPTLQMIAVPVGEAPPAGAIPIGPLADHHGQAAANFEKSSVSSSAFDQFSTASTAASTPLQSPGRQSKAFKIVDPKTGRRVEGTSSDAAPTRRRLRIVNPKTGEEVQATG